MVRLGRPALAFVITCAALPAHAALPCATRLLPAAEAERPRDITSDDLIELLDFGRSDTALGGEPPFSISPDGKSLAVALRRADVAADGYCLGIAVLPLVGHGPVRPVDFGGEFIVEKSDVRGIADLPIGTDEPVVPYWSPDGKWLAYLRRDNGVTQAWIAHADGSGAAALTRENTDVRSVRWNDAGTALIVTTRPGIAESEKQIDAEGAGGFLYDHRFWTLSRSRPKPLASTAPFVERAVDVASGKTIAAQDSGDSKAKPVGALLYAVAQRGDRAWTIAAEPKTFFGPTSLNVEIAGRAYSCGKACPQGIGALWWRDPQELLFMTAAEPENGGIISLYRWRPQSESRPRLLFTTIDALLGCQLLDHDLICARESATHPRVIVRITPDTGRSVVLFDPNPAFSSLRVGKVERLRWTDPKGVPGYGDLVLPPDHRPGQRHPLVVVQYQSRGFLRGGTGDAYPIHVLAARGFAVLSFQRVRPYATGSGATDLNSFQRIGVTGFAERRRMLSAIETGVRASIARGVVDPARIGISGVSDGAASVMFALNNSSLFRVAAMGSCCDDPSTTHFAAGLGYLDAVTAWGYPPPGSSGEDFWPHYSLAANAAKIRAPILLQLTDDEFRFGLETFVTLDHFKVPIEMHVFPDEYHVMWHPAHRKAAYERSIDWFDYWLNGSEDNSPVKAEQYARWRKLSARRSR